jgi:hypothetical protein
MERQAAPMGLGSFIGFPAVNGAHPAELIYTRWFIAMRFF